MATSWSRGGGAGWFHRGGSARYRDDVEAVMSVEGACDWSVECGYFDGKSLQAMQALVYGRGCVSVKAGASSGAVFLTP